MSQPLKPGNAQPLQVKVSILDPAREERRAWQAKRDGKDPNRVRSAVLLSCEFCRFPLGPDALIYDVGGNRACSNCAKKGGRLG